MQRSSGSEIDGDHVVDYSSEEDQGRLPSEPVTILSAAPHFKWATGARPSPSGEDPNVAPQTVEIMDQFEQQRRVDKQYLENLWNQTYEPSVQPERPTINQLMPPTFLPQILSKLSTSTASCIRIPVSVWGQLLNSPSENLETPISPKHLSSRRKGVDPPNQKWRSDGTWLPTVVSPPLVASPCLLPALPRSKPLHAPMKHCDLQDRKLLERLHIPMDEKSRTVDGWGDDVGRTNRSWTSSASTSAKRIIGSLESNMVMIDGIGNKRLRVGVDIEDSRNAVGMLLTRWTLPAGSQDR